LEIEKIIEGCKNGDRRSQDALVRHFAPTLMGVCRRYCGDGELAKDALQETFINVLKYIQSFNGVGSFEGWLRRIAVNASYKFLKKIRPVHFDENNENIGDKDFHVPDVYSTLGKEELMTLVKKLPQAQYLVFNMKVIEGYSHKEIGEMLNISPSTARANLTRARLKMVEMLNKAAQIKLY